MQIETRGLIRRFGSVVALAGVDLTIPSGLRIGLVGPNGSGKSTLLRVLMGLLEHEGEVRVGGFDPRRQRLELARQLADVPQIAPCLAASVTEARAVEALRDSTRRASEPAPKRSVCAGPPSRTSRCGRFPGMRRSCWWRSRSAPAGLLVLDEPTASLDAATRRPSSTCSASCPRPRPDPLLAPARRDAPLVDHVVSLEEGTSVSTARPRTTWPPARCR